MSDDSNSSIGWFLAGLGLGALVGILYAPKSGRETRDQLISSAREGTDYVAQRSQDAREHVTGWVDRGKDVVSRQREQINSAIDAGRQAFRETTAAAEKKTT